MNPLLNTMDLESWLKAFSFSTWRRIEFARTRNRLRIYETTITQTLLIDFRLIAEQLNLPIEMFESKSEKTNGNDFEMYIETSKNAYILFPCQAKIIYHPSNNYPRIQHNIGAFHQIDLLLNYAKKSDGFPLYVFYNFCSNESWNEKISEKIDFEIELFGCSISSAQFLKNHFQIGEKEPRIPNFKDLHPKYAIPFYQITHLLKNDKDAIFSLISGEELQGLRRYPREELMEDVNWINLRPAAQIGKITAERNIRDYERTNESSLVEFQPKFRLIFSRRSRKKGTRITYIH